MAATLKVLSAGAAQGITTSCADALLRATGCALEATFGAVGAMREKFLAGEPCDVLILTAAQIDGLAAEGRVRRDAGGPLGVVRTGIAVRKGDPHPPIGDAASLAAALLAADEIFLADPKLATAGIHFAGVIEKLGLADALAARLRPYPRGHLAMHALAGSKARTAIGCTQLTEIADEPGIEAVGALPPAFELATVYCVAVVASPAAPDAARWLAAALTEPASRDARRARGFEV
jgi:molybdate transport system substrate-binding protein